MTTLEMNLDGLIGPTHNYAGLAHGNVASATNAGSVSHPRQAALQGLQKMKFLHDLGIPQGLLPPHPRPHLKTLKRLGLNGSVAEMVHDGARVAPVLFHHAYSASAMWAANAATVAPSADTPDRTLHFTPANLTSSLHRSLEAEFTAHAFKRIFSDQVHFTHHDPLPATVTLSDEGAANHSRFCKVYGQPGVHLFVYGRSGLESGDAASRRYLPRQTREASETIARLHGLEHVVFAQQHPDAIDAGVFHNDVIAVANTDLLFYHERSFVDEKATLAALQAHLPLRALRVTSSQVPLEDAVKSYLFNSQLVSLPDGSMVLIAPMECRENARTHALLNEILQHGTPIRAVHYLDVRESMKNGGGPACLRLRVVMNEAERQAMHQGVVYSDALHERLANWVSDHYRENLTVEDLTDPALAEESFRALAKLESILECPGLYKEWLP